jgi:hypothetical protein
MTCTERELLDNVVLSVEPTDEKGQMVCVDSFDKPKIGSRLEFVSVYRIYLVKNSDHDIESVKSDRKDYGSLHAKDSLFLYEHQHWEFDWYSTIILKLWLYDGYHVGITFVIPKYGDSDKPYEIKEGRNY